ncbi:MAG: ImmA/IrrE family metallo-endopeptidase [Ignavibacteriales bacterium]|nr:MAG: ImmA/IrrE family metallo-endopeptidase [Ignavibacteriales bacterium]
MKNEVIINTDILAWAIDRAGFELPAFVEKFPNVLKWLAGEKKPTVKQLEQFSKKVYLPFGYLFLHEPPQEKLPIPFFRSSGNHTKKVNINVYDTILLIQQRQNWLRDYLKENSFHALPFVGKFQNTTNVKDIVTDIRRTLNISENWASNFTTKEETINFLVEHIEDSGIITVFNGVVENNGHRKIAIEDCRGFVIVDEIAPFMFINNSDWKSAQMFTMVHELSHIWIGHSAAFDYRNLLPANDPTEILCDKVAAEFLVPESEFNKVWKSHPEISFVSRYFKVSEIVIARRALDTGKISKTQFFDFYNDYSRKKYSQNLIRSTGGDFFALTKKRLSITFASHINNAVKSGKLLYRDAYKLTSLKGDTFQNFFTKYF